MLRDNIEFCEFCGANWQGPPIPVEYQEMYGATHFSRKYGLYSQTEDRTTAYACPECSNLTEVVFGA